MNGTTMAPARLTSVAANTIQTGAGRSPTPRHGFLASMRAAQRDRRLIRMPVGGHGCTVNRRGGRRQPRLAFGHGDLCGLPLTPRDEEKESVPFSVMSRHVTGAGLVGASRPGAPRPRGTPP